MKLKMDYKWVALSVTNVGSFMAALDSSIVVIGLPTILQNLHANIVEGVWIITGYKLMITITLSYARTAGRFIRQGQTL